MASSSTDSHSRENAGEILVSVAGVGKKFCRDLKKSLWYGMTDIAAELLPGTRAAARRANLRPGEFWAVDDVSFVLRRGEVLGLIGHNGAGKTTLLKMLNGLIKPDRGRIEIRGHVGALIALGAGFNPILTGRENVYVNAAVLGLDRQQTAAKLEEIVEFAELQEFIDAPVQTYSSGMAVRLGFAVAAVLIRPDVLFLDEVLAVGDIGFTIKCLNTVRSMTKDAAVVFVSHNMQYVSAFCTRVIVLNRGTVLCQSSDPAVGIDHYFDLVQHAAQVSGSGGAEVLALGLRVNGEILAIDNVLLEQGTSAAAQLTVRIDAGRRGANLLLQINDEAMAPLLCVPVLGPDRRLLQLPPGLHRLEIPLGDLDLNAGKYSFVIAVRDSDTSSVLTRAQGLNPFRVFSRHTYWGKIIRPIVMGDHQTDTELP